MPHKVCILEEGQREGMVERIEDHVDSTSYDWQFATDEEHNSCIKYWADIIRELGYEEKADELIKVYSI